MNAVESVVAAHLDTWNAATGPQRAGSITSVYAPDVFIGEPEAALRGHHGMEQAIAALQAQIPGFTIARSGPIQVAQNLVTYGWTLAVGDGPSLATGRDVLLIGDDQVASLYVVIDAA